MDSPNPAIRLPEAPVVVVVPRGVIWLSSDGEIKRLSHHDAALRLRHGGPPMVCHGRAMARRLNISPFAACDLLELFAFVRPAKFCLPTPRGLARALGLPEPKTHDDEAMVLPNIARALLTELAKAPGREAQPIAWSMARGGWPWGGAVLAALGSGGDAPHSRNVAEGLRIWNRLEEWTETAPEPPGGHLPVEPVEARARLVKLLGGLAEERPQQKEYAAEVAAAFAPREEAGHPHVVLAEAGTGVGKTLGYMAPASVWAEKNETTVWISTYTRNLQRQLDGELDRLYPDPTEKALRAVVRKGRENYLCLLNFEEAVMRLPPTGGETVALGLMARWARASRDGDMIGGDFPAWLSDLLGRRLTIDLTDTRGECIYSACGHYGKCFIEKSVRRARRARIVVANHALVMIQAARAGDDAWTPTRYVFDEGHHVFDAADKAFSAHLTGLEASELRRWILGAEAGHRSRARGLEARIADIVEGEGAATALAEIQRAARCLPGPGWAQRLTGQPAGPTESLLGLLRQQVLARNEDSRTPYGLECEARPTLPDILTEAGHLEAALTAIERPARALVKALVTRLDAEAEELETQTRLRIEAAAKSLERRCVEQIQAWRHMLRDLAEPQPEDFVDWFAVDRIDGRDADIGLHRHWIDPTRPFAATVAAQAHGLLMTSATLRDGSGDDEADWGAAEARTGAVHLPGTAKRIKVPSPFDYAERTRVFVVTDVRKTDGDQVAAAYRALFMASGGGGLGLFTAINRLRTIHSKIAGPLDEAGIPLLAQHVDGLDTGTLIDIFRAEEHACLMGTDAVRDGVDVPGQSLRLIVFERVPWPRADILHKARRKAFGTRGYDDMITRLRLKQAYGRLIRRDGDRGVFVMLDPQLPSRLSGAFPEGVEVRRVGLAEAVAETRSFLSGG